MAPLLWRYDLPMAIGKTKAERKTERIMIRLTKTLRLRLEKLAAKDRRKLATYIEVVLADHAERKRPFLRLRSDVQRRP